VLEPAGLRLVEASDGSEALEAAWREHPDVVLLDVGLPRLSGTDVCRALKTNPQPPSVILLTGNTVDVDGAACGADGIVAKPFRPDALLALVLEPKAAERANEGSMEHSLSLSHSA
jgi:two-component system response regulator MtrA